MANRAYLYSLDQLDHWKRPDRDYYDSRWSIPLAWFFFYRPSAIYMADIRFQGSTWQDVKLVADKDAAVELFKRRQPLLRSVIGGRLDAELVAAFAVTVGSRAGHCLVLDPAEVLGGRSEDDRWHAEQFSCLLDVLQEERVRPEAVLQAASTYVGALEADPDLLVGQVLGYTYWE
jgi:hypothetical protein